MHSGWYQVAFARELTSAVTPLEIERRLIAVREADRVRVFDATCPHRGAHLGHGGTLEGEAIVCPFHGRRIGLGAAAPFDHCVAEYETISVGGMVFARLSKDPDDELPSTLRRIDRDHYYVAGFAMKAPIPADLVIENGFDGSHFQPVHDVCAPPRLTVVSNTGHELRAEGVFVLPRSYWQSGGGETVSVPYTALGFSPGIILSHLGGDNPYYVLTAATPLAKTECVIRLSIAVPAGPNGEAPDKSRCEYVLTQSRKGLEKDLVIWRHMALGAPNRYGPEDASVIAFRQYIARFPAVN